MYNAVYRQVNHTSVITPQPIQVWSEDLRILDCSSLLGASVASPLACLESKVSIRQGSSVLSSAKANVRSSAFFQLVAKFVNAVYAT